MHELLLFNLQHEHPGAVMMMKNISQMASKVGFQLNHIKFETVNCFLCMNIYFTLMTALLIIILIFILYERTSMSLVCTGLGGAFKRPAPGF